MSNGTDSSPPHSLGKGKGKDEHESRKGEETPVRKSQKEMTKAERRALQEKQRAEKEAMKANSAQQKAKGGSANAAKPTPTKPMVNATPQPKTKSINSKEDKKPKQLGLFAHLEESKGPSGVTAPKELHPAIMSLGLQFSEFQISGSNARALATLNAFKKVIRDYQTPPHTTLTRNLQHYLNPQIAYLVNMRPLSVSMGNAIRYLKYEISILSIDLPDEDAKALLIERIDQFIRDRITVADKMIVDFGLNKIQNNDVILTYACSSIVQSLLLEAHTKGISFRVIVVDSRPKLEGITLMKRLTQAGIKCTYVLINAVGFVIKEVSKVFLGAHGMFSNGAMLSRAGTAIVAMMANHQKIPVIVCCETYKFSDRVQLDSFVYNEIGDVEEVASADRPSASGNIKPTRTQHSTLSDWKAIPDLRLLNLLYDLTPSEFITVVISEVGMIPCTSVPVVLREYRPMVQ
ncbi:IF-2B-domain-containing protein [Basidiobolus meristosporus CBS 931.73]|uniref:Translation initiation factor eIF2B subunit delta n=1 Tax=Basidiobolus meristosporus CBS 931.73 TaxID=1314790 RepID=A0A1Y1XNK0_9FUNG|nr:IF-2B-domain-containing protein [Basidiobolus meristosporus CBS 931.73]|eukprot:ORX87086.1 IF-2B-domain-containing protein [Basidiobolus meristosporus CBS 931.73]